MTALQIGVRETIGGRTRTLGLVATNFRRDWAILPTDLSGLLNHPEAHYGIPALELLTAFPLDHSPRPSAESNYVCEPPGDRQDILGETVLRLHAGFGRVPGVVVALRGAVRLKRDDRYLIARDLIEVEFELKLPPLWVGKEQAKDTPTLETGDSGAVVTTQDGCVIGVLIAGGGYTGYVVPVKAFLEKEKLTVKQIETATDAKMKLVGGLTTGETAGLLAALAAEVEREKRDILEAA
jgi:hypothetical protein